MKKVSLLIILAIGLAEIASAQFGREPEFTRQDTLRGTITPERSWWDLTYYHLDVGFDLEDSTISGSNLIQYKVLEEYYTMQIDLQEPLEIEKVVQGENELDFSREGNVYWIKLEDKQTPGSVQELTVFYGGKPREAVRAPWDGGISWERDENGNPFIANSNQGLGASVWWPNKDHMYDEVDSMLISVTVPEDLMDVSNGRLRKVDENGDGTKTWHWYVDNPINNYGVNVSIGDYAHFGEVYDGEKGKLDLDYYVLSYNLDKAKKQFKDAVRMMEAFEYWFGPYPFYEDGFKLIEVPYLGMEHQSAVTYGNKYGNGYLGRDGSGTGWGLKFDFIIIHEAGHEWFANNVTYKDIADMWIHESFTNYSESLFLEYHYGKEAGYEYVRGIRTGIGNRGTIIGKYDVNYEGTDLYNKGGNLLHTLRQIVDSDSLWRETLRGIQKEFYHQTVSTEQIENYMATKTGLSLDGFFDQYLRDNRVPILEYGFRNGSLVYRWTNCVRNFDMPVKVYVEGVEVWLKPTTRFQSTEVDGLSLKVDPDFYVASQFLFDK